jgi:hypothetical protein
VKGTQRILFLSLLCTIRGERERERERDRERQRETDRESLESEGREKQILRFIFS